MNGPVSAKAPKGDYREGTENMIKVSWAKVEHTRSVDGNVTTGAWGHTGEGLCPTGSNRGI